jgi:hypothetical protein
MAGLELIVKILGDASGMSTALSGAAGEVKGFGGVSLKTAALVGGVATAAVAAGIAIYGMASAAGADAAEQEHLLTAIQNAGAATATSTKTVEDAITASQDRAFTDTETRKALEALVLATGNVDQATTQLSTAQDIARASGVDLETASNAVAKAIAGQDGPLRKLLPGLQKGAKATDTLANAQKQAAGQADKFANSTVGQQARISDSFSELGETIGAAFLPALEAILPVVIQVIKILGQLIATILPPLIRLIGFAVSAFLRMAGALAPVVTWLRKIIDAVQDVIAWLGRIHVPKIDLPFGIGKAAPGAVGAGAEVAPFGTGFGRAAGGGVPGGVTINVYGDPAVIQAAVIRALRTYSRRNGLAAVG